MPIWLLVILLTFIWADLGEGSESRGEIRGSVLSLDGAPVSGAALQVREQKGKAPIRFASTTQDGSYRLGDLPTGEYSIKIAANGFYETEIRDVQIERAAAVKELPALRLAVAPFFDCGTDRRPDYYRPLVAAAETGGVRGVVMHDTGVVAEANVTLYMRGKGKIGSQTTRRDGTFSFIGLQSRSEEYWVSISREGYFSEELGHLTVLPGFEGVYAITMESCSPGRCQPELKRVRVLPACA